MLVLMWFDLPCLAKNCLGVGEWAGGHDRVELYLKVKLLWSLQPCANE